MQHSTNYNMNKPDLNDQYRLSHWNENTDIIDEELKKRENDDTALKNPVYTEAGTEAPLVSGELFTTAFGKIAKAISSFITHKATTTSVHGSTPNNVPSKIVERDENGRIRVGQAIESNHASTLIQVDQRALYQKSYIGVGAVADTNITLFGEQIIDGVSCTIGMQVLCIAQANAEDNGVYIVQSGAWTRHSWYYNSAFNINTTGICCYHTHSSYRGKIFYTFVNSYTQYSTPLNYSSSNLYIEEEAKRFWRYKINACSEYAPGIGIPTMWFGPKPDWAIDFGNGSSTKYLWSNYPELNTTQFKNILTTFSSNGWMTAYDNDGFYVPDLRGIVPIGYGINGVRTGENTWGGSVGEYHASMNKVHNHTGNSFSGTQLNAKFGKVGSWSRDTSTPLFNNDDGSYNQGGFTLFNEGCKRYVEPGGNSSLPYQERTMGWKFTYTPAGSVTVGQHGSDKQPSKPATVAFMWIVRFW